eukprot:1448574-Pyramimonas_sp.AAC.1
MNYGVPRCVHAVTRSRVSAGTLLALAIHSLGHLRPGSGCSIIAGLAEYRGAETLGGMLLSLFAEDWGSSHHS